MITKINCINQQHAELVRQLATETQGIRSVLRGRAVVLDIEPSDSRVPALVAYGIGYVTDATAEDEEALRDS